MGRPLNKKYFGNRNVGVGGNQVGGNLSNSQNYADDRIGGEGIAGFTVTAPGNYINRLPTLATFSAPTIANGVQATGVVHSVAQSASPAADGINYWVGDIITDANGSTWSVSELELLSATMTNPGTGYGPNDDIHYANGVVINVDGITGGGGYGPIDGYNIAIRGSFTTPGAPPTTSGTQGVGLGGHDAAFTFVWRIKALVKPPGTPVDYVYGTTYLYGASNVTTGGHGTGAALNVGFSPDHLAVTQKGSGYTGAETITFTTAPNQGETRATGTMVLTTDSGNVGSATNQENAIIIRANLGEGVEVGDIIRQVSTRRYKVKLAAGGVGIVELESGDNTPNLGKAMIIATDSDSNTYYVTKLTAHRATLVRKTFVSLGQWQFESDQSAPWKFFEGQLQADVGYVKIENA